MSSEWSAGERLLLLQAVEHVGPHAWTEVADAVRTVLQRLSVKSTAALEAASCREMFEQLSLQHENLDAAAAALAAAVSADLRRRAEQLEVDARALHARLAAVKAAPVVTICAADETHEHVDIETDEPPPVVAPTPPPQQQQQPTTRRPRRRAAHDEPSEPTPTAPTSRGSSRVASRAASPTPSPLPPGDDVDAGHSPTALSAATTTTTAAVAAAAATATPAAVTPSSKRSTPHRAAAPQSDPLAVIVRTLMQDERALWFRDPVDPAVATEYNDVIREPLHLRAIALALEQEPPPSAEHVWAALLHVFYNAFVFNDPQSAVFQSAHELRCIAAKLILPHLPAHAATYASALAALSPVHTADGHEVELRMPKAPSSAKRKR
jgi:hypothetical protein